MESTVEHVTFWVNFKYYVPFQQGLLGDSHMAWQYTREFDPTAQIPGGSHSKV
jgi:hypothetical protein